MQIQTITIVGQGNVATHYYQIMKEKGLSVKMVSSHLPFHKEDFLSDLVILAVKDDVLESVVLNIKQCILTELNHNQILVHTSGYVETSILKPIAEVYGSFYPLQSLKKGMSVDFNTVPLCTWANTEEAKQELEDLALKLSSIHHTLTDEQRKTIHLAAVFVNNFPNHLFHIAQTILEKDNLSLDILFPLIDRTVTAIKEKDPKLCQTGPAFRHEEKIMQQHLDKLSTSEQQIYKLLSASIMKTKQDETK